MDTRRGEVIRNLDAKREVAGRRPYARWVARYMATLAPDPARVPPVHAGRRRSPAPQRSFGYGFEDLRLVLEPMGGTGADPVWSMGDDTPIPPLSAVPQSLYAYFRQRFAQVTNPPIDPLREAMVMSLRMHLGRRGSPLLERPSYARMLRLEHPVLLPEEMAALRNVAGFSTVTLDARLGHDPRAPTASSPALTALRRAAERAARAGRAHPDHQRPLGRRDPRADPDAAGHRRGAAAPGAHRAPRPGRPRRRGGRRVRHPPLRHPDRLRRGGGASVAGAGVARRRVRRGARAVPARAARPRRRRVRRPAEARLQYRSAAEKGLLKILSKMGISTLSSYCGAQIFEVLGPGPRGHQHLLRGHGVAARRHRLRGDRRGRAGPPSRGVSRRRRRRRRRCPTTAGCASGRRARTTAGRRRSWWRCSRR